MWFTDKWKEYRLLSGAAGEKKEVWGRFTYVRPDPQIIWNKNMDKKAEGVYHRSSTGGGKWEFKNPACEDGQVISYGDLKFFVKPMGFKHMGLFPEQAVNWDFMRDAIEKAGREIRVLNLFAYTGGATVACLKAGAYVCHVDAAKGIVAHARQNVELNHLEGEKIRYIVDDCLKFVQREARRGKVYDAVIMDPPSYGRGPGGEVWKIEDELYNLISACVGILSNNPLFFVVNSYTTGLSPTSVSNLLSETLGKKYGGRVVSDEIGIPFEDSDLVLPCGSTARWISEEM